MSEDEKSSVKRFSNSAQLVRYIVRTTDLEENEVWQKLDEE